MTKYKATEMMYAYSVAVGQEICFPENFGFCAGDVITIYDRNGVKWYEVKMKNSTTGIIIMLYVI